MNKIKPILTIVFLPFVLLKDAIQLSRPWYKKVLYVLAILFVFGFTWKNAYKNLYETATVILFDAGITDKLSRVTISGTSMVPTLTDGQTVELHSGKKFSATRGDIVSFKNDETGGLYYIKRIVGLPGESISIKNGTVVVGDKALKENYTNNGLPTFGNSFLSDCEVKNVPTDSFFVMGDNRTVSFDSRAIGFVKRRDLEGILKGTVQPEFVPEQQVPALVKKTIDPAVFVKKLNEKRKDAQVIPLATYSLLNQLAEKRAKQISDTFQEWKQKTTSAENLLKETGYRYNLVHEFVTYGYLDEQSIIDQIVELTSEKDAFLSARFTEVGIGVAEKQYLGCTFPIISVILSWPSVPTYEQGIVEYWQKESTYTTRALPNLQAYVGVNRYDQTELRELITIVAEMSDTSARVVGKMQRREWLTEKDYGDMNRYQDLVKKENELAKSLFGPNVQGASTQVPQ